MVVDVLNDRVRHNVSERKVPLAHQANLGARNIILWNKYVSNAPSAAKHRVETYSDHLGDDMNVVLVILQARQGLINVGAGPLDDEGAEVSQDVIQICRGPDPRRAHGLDQVGSSEQGNTHGLLVAMDILAAANNLVDLVVEVVEDLGSGEVVGLNGLPGVAGQPLGGLLCGVGAHLNSVFGGCQAGLLVGIGDRGQEATDYFILGVEASVVGGHLKHAQVEIGYGAAGIAAFVSKVACLASSRTAVIVEERMPTDLKEPQATRTRGVLPSCLCLRSSRSEGNR